MKIILASNSPRRRELLGGLGLDFEVKVIKGVEETYPANLPKKDVASYIAVEKATAYTPADDELIITADTIVIVGDEILGKPHDADDACPDMGDSAITETFGVGGMAMIAAPAVTRFVGAGGYEDALRTSNEMMEIVTDRNPNFTVPTWNFQGICLGIDARLVVEKGITPVINTGIANKVAGKGQIGAGTVHPPIECFEKAIVAYAKKLGFEA